MPTLFRFLTIIAVLVGLFYAGMFALVWYVKPNEGEITVRIPVGKVNPKLGPKRGPDTASEAAQ
ncbi:MAG: histidine kinase [Hyphomicrobiales bacterium]|nr:histidine kinase [Hyphomicrobiales bacterium]